ncbi:Rossmann fold nucleotide-binding protein involved in DNA uptake-like protein (fragment) [Nitrolancea hollandica Lb]|uniref:Rossmann fold nucleotide-binding protein involved in DNA uptake-like protein n=2 Tax=Nitrolancea hollandica TaxID=1206749 RepID=I4EFC3_9BACT
MLSPDTQVTLLLCGRLGQPASEDAPPLTPSEYHRLTEWLESQGSRPARLLEPGGLDLLPDEAGFAVDRDRIAALLERGGSLALAVESWANRGIWVLGRGDNAYPERLRRRLGRQAPLLLYGAGNLDLLQGGGLAVAGSRDADAGAIDFTRRIAGACAGEDIPIIAGGARGVDAEAISSAIVEGGRAVGVLADSLARAITARRYRDHLRDGALTLASPFDPAAGFNVGNAMSRNKIIYALGDWSLVTACVARSGGTWAGAVENLKSRWSPLFVRAGDVMPEGNRLLIDGGGIALDPTILDQPVGLRGWLDKRSVGWSDGNRDTRSGQAPGEGILKQLPLFGDPL